MDGFGKSCGAKTLCIKSSKATDGKIMGLPKTICKWKRINSQDLLDAAYKTECGNKKFVYNRIDIGWTYCPYCGKLIRP